MNRSLIVNADDYGRTLQVSEGIRFAHLNGIVTTTTVMMNLPGAVEDVLRAMTETPEMGLGVHLNLTYGMPAANPIEVLSLTDENGRFYSRNTFIERLGEIDIGEVLVEWRQQIERFLQTGAELDHLDSHHHVAVFNEDLWATQLQLASEYNCSVRPPIPSDVPRNAMINILPPGSMEFAAGRAIELLKEYGLNSPDQFLASFFAENIDLHHLKALIMNFDAGVSEIMCHPGYVDAELSQSSGYAKEREQELDTLTSPDLPELLREAHIQLRTYMTAWEA